MVLCPITAVVNIEVVYTHNWFLYTSCMVFVSVGIEEISYLVTNLKMYVVVYYLLVTIYYMSYLHYLNSFVSADHFMGIHCKMPEERQETKKHSCIYYLCKLWAFITIKVVQRSCQC